MAKDGKIKSIANNHDIVEILKTCIREVLVQYIKDTQSDKYNKVSLNSTNMLRYFNSKRGKFKYS